MICPKTLCIENFDLELDLKASIKNDDDVISEDFDYTIYETLMTSKEKTNYLISHDTINEHNIKLLLTSIESDIFDAFLEDPQDALFALKIILIHDIDISYNEKIGELIISFLSNDETSEICQFLILHYVLKNQVTVEIINSLTKIIYDEKTPFTSTMMNFTSKLIRYFNFPKSIDLYVSLLNKIDSFSFKEKLSFLQFTFAVLLADKQIVHILFEYLNNIKIFLFDMLEIKPLLVIFIISSIDEIFLSDEFIDEFNIMLMNLSTEI